MGLKLALMLSLFGNMCAYIYQNPFDQDWVNSIKNLVKIKDKSRASDDPIIALEILHGEQILPHLPLMNQWGQDAFQRPPYSYAGIRDKGLVDPQDIFYVNDPHGRVIIAKSEGRVVGVAAGIPFDSRDIHDYFESRHEGAYREISQLGFDPSQIFYITYILTEPEFKDHAALSRSIVDALQTWAARLEKKQICWWEDSSHQQASAKKVETWKDDVGGFKEMGLQLSASWPTYQKDGSIKEDIHTMKFFFKEIDKHPNSD